MKILTSITAFTLLSACNWIGSASYSYSDSWQRKSCDAAKVSEFEMEYQAKIKEYKKKFDNGPGQLRYEMKNMNGCKSFFVGYSNEKGIEHSSESETVDGLKEIKNDVLGS